MLVVGGGTLDLADSVVTGIREHPTLTGAQGGTGIMVGTSGGETGTLDLRDTVVSEYQKTGIIVRANSRATIERAEIVGQGWVCQIAMNGIQIQGEATIIDSVVRDNRYEKVPAPAPPTPDPCGSDKTATPVGIMVFSPTGPVTVTGSTIAGNEIGVYVSQTSSSPITFQNDDVTGLLGDPLATEGSYGLYLASSGGGSGVVADGNQVQNADYGIMTSGPQSVTSNLVQSNGVGVSLLDPPALVAANALLGNATGLEGTYANPGSNWYGCNDGPGSPGCDSIAGGYVEPAWLVFTMALSGCTVAAGGSLEVTAAITQTSAGGATSGHFVPELPITPISGTGVTPLEATSTLVGGTATLGFEGSTAGPAALSATAQHQVVSSPGAATGCATGVTVTFPELAPTGDDAAVPAIVARRDGARMLEARSPKGPRASSSAEISCRCR